MDVIGFVAGNMWWFLLAAIVSAVISIIIIVRAGKKAVNHVMEHGLEDALDMMAGNPEKVAKSAGKTWLEAMGFHVITAICWLLFVVSAIINVALWIKGH